MTAVVHGGGGGGGQRVTLAPLGEEHLPLVRRWRSDPEVTRYWISDQPPSEAEVRAWYQGLQASDVRTWVILDEQGEPIGYTNLFDLDPVNRRAELALMIGERRVWGRGYAQAALRTLLGHAFASQEAGGLGLHKISLTVFAENVAARRAYAACGFREDGVLRDDFYRAGRWHDQLLMSVLESEFTGGTSAERHAQPQLQAQPQAQVQVQVNAQGRQAE